ncbi:MAG TPA: hypothetical protein VN175_14260 [Rhizomicrobium sp.]|nr:hypothetical protein [Rhizomicrobium sp.]
MAIRTFAFLFFTTSMTPAALAAPSAELKTLLDREPALSDGELAGMRAGFITAGGAQFDFGASIKTMVNGQVALLTNLQWTNAGAVTQQLAGLGQSIQSQVNNTVASNLAKAGIASPLTDNAASNAASTAVSNPASNVAANAVASTVAAGNAASNAASNAAASTAASNAAASNTAQTAESAASPAAAAPAPALSTASAPAIVTGVQIPGVGGSTQVISNLSANQIQSIILNSASGQTITQNTDITFTIYNFQAWQQLLAQRMVAAQLASGMLAASGFTAGH